jgi:hypothetical protein
MVAKGGHIEVSRGNFTAREYIYVCRPDGRALVARDLPHVMLDQLVKQSFVLRTAKRTKSASPLIG